MSTPSVPSPVPAGPATNRAPGTIWALRRDCRDYVRTIEGDLIMVVVDGHEAVWMDRAKARLLAKRLNQCLDGTARS